MKNISKVYSKWKFLQTQVLHETFRLRVAFLFNYLFREIFPISRILDYFPINLVVTWAK